MLIFRSMVEIRVPRFVSRAPCWKAGAFYPLSQRRARFSAPEHVFGRAASLALSLEVATDSGRRWGQSL